MAPTPSPLRVNLNTHVCVEWIGENPAAPGERLEFDIVPDEQADFYSGLLGLGSPLARALLGKTAGSVIPYRAGDMRQVRILSVAAAAQPASDAAAQRKAQTQEAIEQAQRASAITFATTVEGKWGEYDADSLLPPPGEPKPPA